MIKKFNKFETYSINEENENHYLEILKNAYSKEIDPFPINIEFTFKNVDDNLYEISLRENYLDIMTPYPHEETIVWNILRQTLYEIMGGKNYFTDNYFYITNDGLQTVLDRQKKFVSGYIGEAHILINKTAQSEEELFIILDEILIKPYKKYGTDAF